MQKDLYQYTRRKGENNCDGRKGRAGKKHLQPHIALPWSLWSEGVIHLGGEVFGVSAHVQSVSLANAGPDLRMGLHQPMQYLSNSPGRPRCWQLFPGIKCICSSRPQFQLPSKYFSWILVPFYFRRHLPSHDLSHSDENILYVGQPWLPCNLYWPVVAPVWYDLSIFYWSIQRPDIPRRFLSRSARQCHLLKQILVSISTYQ